MQCVAVWSGAATSSGIHGSRAAGRVRLVLPSTAELPADLDASIASSPAAVPMGRYDD